MIKLIKIFNYIITFIMMVLSLFFIVIEGRNLISGEISIFNNVVSGYISYSFRLILALAILSICIFNLVYFIKKDSKVLSIYVAFNSIGLLISSIIIGIYATNYINILFIVLGSLYFISIIAYFLKAKLNPFLLS